jgi:hypothetical protein
MLSLIPILLPIIHSTTPSLPHTLVAFGDLGHAENVDLLDRINHYLDKVDGVFLLGDNFYPSGICPELGLDDPQFALFSDHLATNLSVPFFVVLGNHDYMQNGQSAEIEYKHPLWVIDDGPYFVQFPFTDEWNACVWFVDSIHFTPSSVQGLSSSISDESPRCVWKILATHYPVITAGVYKDDATVGDFREKISCDSILLFPVTNIHLKFYLIPIFATLTFSSPAPLLRPMHSHYTGTIRDLSGETMSQQE